MGLISGGGGFGQHNPMYRRQSEDMMTMQRLGEMYQANPEMVEDYLSNHPEGQVMKDRLGLKSVYDLDKYTIPGMPTLDNYQQIYDDVGAIDPAVAYDQAGYDPFEYQGYDVGVQDITDRAYDQAQLMQEESAQRGFQRALSQMEGQYGSRGLDPRSGVAGMGRSDMGRGFMQQISDMGRQTAMNRAQDMQKAEMFEKQLGSNLDLQRQAKQAGERQFATTFRDQQNRFASGLDQYAKNMQLQKSNAQANALGMIENKAMQPYNMMGQYFGQTAGLTGPPKTKGAFGKIIGGIGSLADSAAKVGGMF